MLIDDDADHHYPNSPDGDSSASKSTTTTTNGSHHFTVKGYSLAKGMGPGRYISSDLFSVGGYDWAIYFYPDGKNIEDNCAYVSVFIALASEGTDVRALFELTLVDQSGNGKHKVNSHFDRALESGPYSLKYKGSMWGYKRFFRRTALEASDYIKDDCLLMQCTVGVVRNHLEGPKEYSISVPPSNIGQDLKYLLESEVCCDVVFHVGEEKFKAHKMILAARSPVFRAQFYGLIGKTDMDEVVLPDLEPSIFKAMLQFIYSDKLPDLHEITGSSSMCTSTIMMQHLLAAADCFGLDRLKQLCEAKLCDEITIDTVVTTLPLAEQHHCPQLKAICLKFAAANLGVMQVGGFKHLEENYPSLLSELLETVATIDEKYDVQQSTKHSSSSILGLDLAADGAVAESVNPYVRRLRRRH